MSRNLKRKLFQQMTHSLPRRNLRDEMISRKPPLIYDYLDPVQHYKLEMSLRSFLPPHWTTQPDALPDIDIAPPTLPPAHHLVYFNPAIPAHSLLPDGTDPLQSPGAPYVRRMWAGGMLKFNPYYNSGAGIKLDGSRWVCHEFIRDVERREHKKDMVFVTIERRFARYRDVMEAARVPSYANAVERENVVRRVLWHEEGEMLGGWEGGGREGVEDGVTAVVETRNIVFMLERGEDELRELRERKDEPGKFVKPQDTPDFSHTLTPTPSLLFRYSALTFNAHSIHLDPSYTQNIEGHRNLLVHGPLSLTLLLTLLCEHLKTAEPSAEIFKIDYRNVAPLYCNEPMKLCLKRKEGRGWVLWIENKQGGVCVRGVAKTAGRGAREEEEEAVGGDGDGIAEGNGDGDEGRVDKGNGARSSEMRQTRRRGNGKVTSGTPFER